MAAIFPTVPTAGDGMCDSSVFLWLQQIRYQTENYEVYAKSESEMTTEVIGTRPPPLLFPFVVKHANEHRISCEFVEESVEELSLPTKEVVVHEHVEEPEDVMQWKCEIRYEYSSEEEGELMQQVSEVGASAPWNRVRGCNLLTQVQLRYCVCSCNNKKHDLDLVARTLFLVPKAVSIGFENKNISEIKRIDRRGRSMQFECSKEKYRCNLIFLNK